MSQAALDAAFDAEVERRSDENMESGLWDSDGSSESFEEPFPESMFDKTKRPDMSISMVMGMPHGPWSMQYRTIYLTKRVSTSVGQTDGKLTRSRGRQSG